ncbi:protein-export chaperone SecB [soil metagenome]
MIDQNKNDAGIENNSDSNNPEFYIQRVYTKDISFEAPNTPQIFTQEWAPEMNLDIQSQSARLDDQVYEVTLSLTLTVNSQKKLAFLAEVKEAGIFTLKNIPESQMGPVLGAVCLGILFPYAREMVSNLVTRGGFPPVYLTPVNFEALYAQQQEQQKKPEEATTEH